MYVSVDPLSGGISFRNFSPDSIWDFPAVCIVSCQYVVEYLARNSLSEELS